MSEDVYGHYGSVVLIWVRMCTLFFSEIGTSAPDDARERNLPGKGMDAARKQL